eukprot:CAMPEP_0174298656 /NCGR_PEP_ID=MMETSP0809-20121228/54488_1 /TAXON_ID=73025 ORGANISM="Eutreptiella gymnastica-like, Strain CCMP1594" /NCGR_SAMPLE_ID=MMETSP0809 /ASSEMBLY_ACC=CAM_ASM_000658 /LENGTH=37 /DNA_ID= /DNA_START= /DNA_END= /DNA_ORIENTATION=
MEFGIPPLDAEWECASAARTNACGIYECRCPMKGQEG